MVREPPGPIVAAVEPSATEAVPDDEAQLVQVADGFDIAPIRPGDSFTDIPGDPLILTLPDAAAWGKKTLAGQALDTARVGPPAPDRLTLIETPLIEREQRLMTTLPSTREDFALFQAQRGRSLAVQRVASPAPVDPLIDDAESETRDHHASTLFLRPEAIREALSQDLVLDLSRDASFSALLTSHGFTDDRAQKIVAEAGPVLEGGDNLAAGTVLAIRFAPEASGPELLQMSLYGPDGWQGSLAKADDGLVRASDPWLDDDIAGLARAQDPGGASVAQGARFRLLDAVYSAAIRAEVPTEIVGEMIAMVAQVHDLDAYADEDDRLTLVFATDPDRGSNNAGRLLFAGIDGPSGVRRCYVVPREDGPGYRCHAPGARLARAEGGGLNLTMPVAGTIAQKFGPLGQSNGRPDGIGFAAARGSVVSAAAAGHITAIDNASGGMGRSITLDHGTGFSTRYGWLDTVREGLGKGDLVAAGDPIGTVGAPPGGSGAPALAFQVLSGGTPVDPLPLLSGGVTIMASDAVEALIGRIIRVESAGNARARNPLSSATGLGQFIDSTWLRMMRSYRPDLTASMAPRDLLALRFDAALSRDMVRHLAQENEAYLRARGHQITPGRLYLAHFLGPEGADRVLSAPNDQTVLAVMGAGVVRANPFLSGYSVATLKAWADRKMNTAPLAGDDAGAEPPPSPAVTAYVAAMDAILAEGRSL
ncbi:M23 family metallopeptidase (plasmid) [Paracoccus sp. TK19116]|uniref:M23 family metallopeptidase n=2 Tax=Paracoccus albicereus TaxID=2922394 RepID=A0ABT1MMN3_9RHOB|nr:M23 family metallopeptidase [Paracoccus albicereus]